MRCITSCIVPQDIRLESLDITTIGEADMWHDITGSQHLYPAAMNCPHRKTSLASRTDILHLQSSSQTSNVPPLLAVYRSERPSKHEYSVQSANPFSLQNSTGNIVRIRFLATCDTPQCYSGVKFIAQSVSNAPVEACRHNRSIA